VPESPLPAPIQRVVDAAARKGVTLDVHVFTESTHTAEEAARAVDAELGQIERLLKLGNAGAAGSCPGCGALQARGAVFCWQCGNELRPAAKSEAEPKAKPPG